MEVKGGSMWWNELLGISPELTQGELDLKSSSPENWLAAQEHQDARRLIEIGIRNNDPEALNIGRARLRMLTGRETPDDLELFRKD